jgi:hypothetical protein
MSLLIALLFPPRGLAIFRFSAAGCRESKDANPTYVPFAPGQAVWYPAINAFECGVYITNNLTTTDILTPVVEGEDHPRTGFRVPPNKKKIFYPWLRPDMSQAMSRFSPTHVIQFWCRNPYSGKLVFDFELWNSHLDWD